MLRSWCQLAMHVARLAIELSYLHLVATSQSFFIIGTSVSIAIASYTFL